MFYKLKKTLIAAALLPLALGCKREGIAPTPNQLGAAPETNKVQQWLKGQPLPLAAQERKASTTLPKHTLQWQAAGFDAATNTHWVPADFDNTKKAGGKHSTYLVTPENKQGQITGGQYIMLLPNAKKMGASAANGLTVALLAAKPNALLAGFSGALLYYDLTGQLTGSQVYEAGQLQPYAKANLAARDEAEGDPDPNTVIQECGGALGIEACIDWYWQTYVNGVLTEEDYMFTTCCSGTSSGGSGGNSNAECQAQLDAMVAAGHVVTDSPITETTEAQSNTEWTKRYSWIIFKAVTWGLVSYERAVLEKVHYPSSNQTMWEYKTFDHVSIGEFGMTAIGTYTHADLGATINKTKYTAYVQVDFSVTSKACGIITQTNVYNATKKFVAPNHVQYINISRQAN